MQDSDWSWAWKSWTSKKLLISLGWTLFKAHAPLLDKFILWSDGVIVNGEINEIIHCYWRGEKLQSKVEFSKLHFIRDLIGGTSNL